LFSSLDTSTRDQLINKAVELLVDHNCFVPYGPLISIFYTPQCCREADPMLKAAIVLAASTLGVNIPLWSNGAKTFVPLYQGVNRAILFTDTFREEESTIDISNQPGGLEKYRTSGDIIIGRLKARDPHHEFLRQGSGGDKCDCIGIDTNLLVEVKHNLRNGSPSSCHDAEVVFNWLSSTKAELLPVYHDPNRAPYLKKRGIVLPDAKPIATYDFTNYKGEVPLPVRKHIYYIDGLRTELNTTLMSGELIPAVETALGAHNIKMCRLQS
jgi:hypothetical protein